MKLHQPIILVLACLLTSCTARVETPMDKQAKTTETQPDTTAPPAAPAPNRVVYNGKSIEAPAGSPITIKETTTKTDAGSFSRNKGTAEGTGAGIVSSFEKAVVNFNASAPLANILGFGGSSGGSTDIAATFAGKAGTPAMAWLGALLFLGGVAAFIFKRIRDGCILCAAGLVAVGASMLGPVGWLVIILLFAGIAGYFWWVGQKGLRASEALRGVVAGVESAPDEARKLVKAAISNHADERDKATIRAVKKADDLPSERA